MIVYIMGRGHSGSTMLDAILGNANKIESVGELVSGMGRYNSLCSCGKAFKDCSFWNEVRNKFEKATGVSWAIAAQRSVRQAHIRRFLATIIANSSTEWVAELKRINENLEMALRNQGTEIVVDSSKEITRALFLVRFVPESKIIHLVRHPEKILQSNYHRMKKGSGFKFLRSRVAPSRCFGFYLFITAVSWMIGNILSEVIRFLYKKRFLRVRYEDLINLPMKEIERIEKFTETPLRDIKRRLRGNKPFVVGHNIGGNHMRMAKKFIIDPSKAVRKGLPKRYSIMVNAICWPFLWAYGYKKKSI